MPEQSEPLTARKLTTFMTISEELLHESYILIGDPLTDAEREEMRRQDEARFRAAQVEHERVVQLCAGQPGALAALEVHKPVDRYVVCCDLDESDELPTDWPCSTFEAIRNAVTP